MSKFSDMGSIMNVIGMKRFREEYSDQFDSITAMANCLMLLSGAGGDQFQPLSNAANDHHHHRRQYRDVSPSRVFECKTCNRQFSSFQALGGHRASHKKPKLGGDLSLQSEASPVKPKTHECSICGQEFAVGQALGGHMRRHRAALSESPAVAAVISESSTNSEKRIWGLDLNLAPLENDDLDFELGCKMASPLVLDCVS